MATLTDPQSRKSTFVDMSAALTGFARSALSPTLDPIGLAQQYLAVADRHASVDEVNRLLAAYLEIQAKPPQQVADVLLEVDAAKPSHTASLARSIVKLWYLGSWYAAGSSAFAGQVVSANAYIAGLAWKAAQAHPMGYSEFSFGYWSSAPPTLGDFGAEVTGPKGSKRR